MCGYLNSDEERIVSQDAGTKSGVTRDGELICTDQRLIYRGGFGNVIDISIPSISVVKYEEDILSWISIIGMSLIGISSVIFLFGQIADQFTDPIFSVLPFGIGCIFIGADLLFGKKQTLTIQTESDEFTFVTTSNSSLKEIVHAIRAVENDQYSR